MGINGILECRFPSKNEHLNLLAKQGFECKMDMYSKEVVDKYVLGYVSSRSVCKRM